MSESGQLTKSDNDDSGSLTLLSAAAVPGNTPHANELASFRRPVATPLFHKVCTPKSGGGQCTVGLSLVNRHRGSSCSRFVQLVDPGLLLA